MTRIKPFFFSALVLHLVLGSPIPLENDVQAHRYDVKLSLLEDKTSFTGDEVVSIKVIKETSVLRLKYSNADISTVTVYDPQKPKDELVKSYNREEDNSLHVNLLSPLQTDTVYIVGTEFSGTFENDMTFERLFEQKGNGNIFPCFENSDSQTIYQMSISLSLDGEQNEMKSMDVNEDTGDIAEGSTNTTNTEDPSSQDPSTEDPNTEDPNTEHPTTQGPNTQDPSSQDPSTQGPNTQDPSSQDPSTEDPSANPASTTPTTTTTDSDNAASFSMISTTLLSIVAICVISLR